MFPILFEFGFITVFSLWFLVAAGFVAGSMLFTHLAKRHRVKLNLITEHSFFIFLCALLIARTAFVLTHADIFFSNFNTSKFIDLFEIWDKGISFWGALTGFVGSIFYLSWTKKESPARLLDILIPAIFIGMCLGDIGALLDGINYGSPTNLPWGITFRSANVKYITPIHPTQMYAAIASLLFALGLLRLLKHLRAMGGNVLPGFTAELGLVAFSVYKFFEEFFRGDEVVEIFGIRAPQLAAIAGMLVAGYFLYQRYYNKNGSDPTHLLKKFVEMKFSRIAGKKSDSSLKSNIVSLPS